MARTSKVYSLSFDSAKHVGDDDPGEYEISFDRMENIKAMQLGSVQLPNCQKVPSGTFEFKEGDQQWRTVSFEGGSNMAPETMLSQLGALMSAADFRNVPEEHRGYRVYNGGVWSDNQYLDAVHHTASMLQTPFSLNEANRVKVDAEGVWMSPLVAQEFGFARQMYFVGPDVQMHVGERDVHFGSNNTYEWFVDAAGKVRVAAKPGLGTPARFQIRFSTGPLATILGFKAGVHYAPGDDGGSGGGNTVIASNGVNTMYPRYLVLRLLDHDSQNLHEGKTILAKIMFSPTNISEQMMYTQLPTPLALHRLRLRWEDENGDKVDFQGRHHTLTFLFTVLEGHQT